MATFTTVTKRKALWEAPPPEEVTGEAYELLIGGGFKLNIGSGYNLTIQPGTVSIQWTNTNKVGGKNLWPTFVNPDTFLDIGNGYNLLIQDGHKLLIGDGNLDKVPGDIWTNVSRNSKVQY